MILGSKNGLDAGRGALEAPRILLVDDRRSALLTMKFRFARLGIDTTIFDEEPAALAAFEHQPSRFDAIVASLAMRRVRGDAFAKRAWSIAPDIPITILSGLPFQERVEDAPIETDVCMVANAAPLSEILLSLESQGLRVPRGMRNATARERVALFADYAA